MVQQIQFCITVIDLLGSPMHGDSVGWSTPAPFKEPSGIQAPSSLARSVSSFRNSAEKCPFPFPHTNKQSSLSRTPFAILRQLQALRPLWQLAQAPLVPIVTRGRKQSPQTKASSNSKMGERR